MPISLVGKTERVVDAPGLSIDELIGNVASKNDDISIAHVTVKAGTKEPILTLHYDEYICVLKGEVVLTQQKTESSAETVFKVPAGQSAFLSSGTRFQPTFPVDSVYVPVCLPAFRPDRCVREDIDAESQEISANLKKLHNIDTKTEEKLENPVEKIATTDDGRHPEIMYHMTSVAEWEAAKSNNIAYFPREFERDGYTHATAVPRRLIDTANHFYQDIPGDWVCLQFTRSALKKIGIVTKDEAPGAVADEEVDEKWVDSDWICPHVFGGIAPSVVTREFKMRRNGTIFVGIEGVC